ncbi:MAG: hypothetical protein C5B49_07595 [Bdellovibrio sp.]|nr:MAG: hypothetical protein C5B49_07595 [Bdellovibrio sp.]
MFEINNHNPKGGRRERFNKIFWTFDNRRAFFRVSSVKFIRESLSRWLGHGCLSDNLRGGVIGI